MRVWYESLLLLHSSNCSLSTDYHKQIGLKSILSKPTTGHRYNFSKHSITLDFLKVSYCITNIYLDITNKLHVIHQMLNVTFPDVETEHLLLVQVLQAVHALIL